MTAVPLPLAIPRDEVVRFLGYGAGQPRPAIEEMLESVCAEARGLAAGVGIHRVCSEEEVETLGLPGTGVPLALGLVTIGGLLEARVSELLAEGSSTRALLLDAAGSAAVEEAADSLERIMGYEFFRGRRAEDSGGISAGVSAGQKGSLPGRVSRRFSPGYGSWPLTAQRPVFGLLPHREIEVALLPSLLMVPRKSISFALWLEGVPLYGPPRPGTVPPADPCQICGLASCRHRRGVPPSAGETPSAEDTP